MMEYPKKSYDQLTDIQKAKVDKKKEREQSFIIISSILVIMTGVGIFFFY